MTPSGLSLSASRASGLSSPDATKPQAEITAPDPKLHLWLSTKLYGFPKSIGSKAAAYLI